MSRHQHPFLARCAEVLSRRGSRRRSNSRTGSIWPRNLLAQPSVDVTEGEDCAPLLESSHVKALDAPTKRLQLLSKDDKLGEGLIKPSRCHLRSPRRINAILSTIFLFIILLVPASSAVPLSGESLVQNEKRQSIPDRFGNTGTEPGPGNPQDSLDAISSVVVIPSVATSVRVVPTTTSATQTAVTSAPATSTRAPTSTLRPVSTNPVSSILVLPSTPVSPLSTASLPAIVPGTSQAIPSSTLFSGTSSTAEALLRTTPIDPLAPAVLAGIITGGVVLIALLLGLAFFLYRRRRKAHEIEEIPIRRSKLGSRLAYRVFGSHYDERIARSRSRSGSRDDGRTKFTERKGSAASLKKDMTLQVPKESYGRSQPLISPSVYSPRLTRISTMTFGSVSGWLDKSAIGRPMPAFTGTPSQLLDAPKPLFAKPEKTTDEKWVGKESISPPRPARPGSAEPLGRLSGMGYGLGSGHSK